MNDTEFTSTIVVVLPGNHVVTYVVVEGEEGTRIEAHADEHVPPASAPLQLLSLCGSLLPAGHAGFHIWKALSALKENFEEYNSQMANVPAISEDELPF